MPPSFEFSNPDDPEEKHVIFLTIDEPKVYEVKGVAWDRVWSVPYIGVPKVDAFNERKFLENTDKTLPLGELWDRGKELSQIRAEKNGGVDPIKEKFKKEQDAKDLAIKKARRAAKTKGKK